MMLHWTFIKPTFVYHEWYLPSCNCDGIIFRLIVLFAHFFCGKINYYFKQNKIKFWSWKYYRFNKKNDIYGFINLSKRFLQFLIEMLSLFTQVLPEVPHFLFQSNWGLNDSLCVVSLVCRKNKVWQANKKKMLRM